MNEKDKNEPGLLKRILVAGAATTICTLPLVLFTHADLFQTFPHTNRSNKKKLEEKVISNERELILNSDEGKERIKFSINQEIQNYISSLRKDEDSQTDENYVRKIVNEGYLDDLSEKILEGDLESDIKQVRRFMSENLKYISDGNNQYMKHTLETLMDGGGDCEDLSALMLSLFKESGRKGAIVYEPGHASAAIEIREEENNINSLFNLGVYSKKRINKSNLGTISEKNATKDSSYFRGEGNRNTDSEAYVYTPDIIEIEGDKYIVLEPTDEDLSSIKIDTENEGAYRIY